MFEKFVDKVNFLLLSSANLELPYMVQLQLNVLKADLTALTDEGSNLLRDFWWVCRTEKYELNALFLSLHILSVDLLQSVEILLVANEEISLVDNDTSDSREVHGSPFALKGVNQFSNCHCNDVLLNVFLILGQVAYCAVSIFENFPVNVGNLDSQLSDMAENKHLRSLIGGIDSQRSANGKSSSLS